MGAKLGGMADRHEGILKSNESKGSDVPGGNAIFGGVVGLAMQLFSLKSSIAT